MSIVTISLLKAHIGTDELLDPSIFGDIASANDELLQHYIDAAEDYVANRLGKPLSDPEFDPMPAAIKQAVLLVAAHFYENREASLIGVNGMELLIGVSDLLRTYRREVTGRGRE
jgi:Phage gp6-like head-tail connector protein